LAARMSRELCLHDGFDSHGRQVDVAEVRLPGDPPAVLRALGWSAESADRVIERALGLPQLAADRMSAVDRKRVIRELRRQATGWG